MPGEDTDPVGQVHVNAGRLWAGGAATAVVAALGVVVGIVIARGVLGIPVLAPATADRFGNSPSTAVYAALAAGCALLATALLHVLLLGTPAPSPSSAGSPRWPTWCLPPRRLLSQRRWPARSLPP
jgi:hypothetical protein